MVVILDTNILIDLFRGNKKTLESLKRYSREIFAITSITIFELWLGKLKDREIFVIESLPKYSFDSNSAKIAAIIYKSLKQEGKIPEAHDLFIAAICISRKFKLITKDKGFERFREFGLDVEII